MCECTLDESDKKDNKKKKYKTVFVVFTAVNLILLSLELDLITLIENCLPENLISITAADTN